MKKVLLVLMLGFLTVTFANANNYKLNDQAIDNLFASAQNVTFNEDGAIQFPGMSMPNAQLSEKTPVIAFIICTLVGNLGIHRLYMGTEVLTVIGYICTGGGCGVVVLVDWVMLIVGIIDNDISKYIDNPKFFMWL